METNELDARFLSRTFGQAQRRCNRPVSEESSIIETVTASNIQSREGDLNAVVQAFNGVMVIAGDSGIGKSWLLRAVASPEVEAVTSDIRNVVGVDDSLRSAIAMGLGDCVRAHQEAHPADFEIWSRLAAVVQSATTEGAKNAGALIVEALYGIVAAKIGQAPVDVIRSMVADVLRSAHEGFEARLGELVVTDVATELNNIAGEIAAWTGVRIIVRLDKGEQLSATDVLLLTSVANLEEPTFLTIVAISSADPDGSRALDLLARRGVRVHVLEALEHHQINEWLNSSGIEPAKWSTIEHLTTGYPLFIEAAIALSKSGVGLTELQPDAQFLALQNSVWKQLNESRRIAAGKLAVFADAPPTDFICQYLAIDVHELGELKAELLEKGIFVATTDGA